MVKKGKSFFTTLFFIFVIIAVMLWTFRGIFPIKHKEAIEKYCGEYGVNPPLVYALIKAESNFQKNALSHAGAKGLMQITDETFEYCLKKLGIPHANIFNAEANIQCGIWYLSYLLEKYDNNTKNAVAAYNAGETNVDRWLKDSRYSRDSKTLSSIPFGETKRHVEKIQRYAKIYEYMYF